MQTDPRQWNGVTGWSASGTARDGRQALWTQMKGARTDPFQLDAGVKSLKNSNFLKNEGLGKCDKTRKSSRRKLILGGTSRGIKFRNKRIATIWIDSEIMKEADNSKTWSRRGKWSWKSKKPLSALWTKVSRCDCEKWEKWRDLENSKRNFSRRQIRQVVAVLNLDETRHLHFKQEQSSKIAFIEEK